MTILIAVGCSLGAFLFLTFALKIFLCYQRRKQLSNNNDEDAIIDAIRPPPLSISRRRVVQDAPENWIAVIGSFACHFILLGVLFSFGVYQNHYDMSQNFGSPAIISLIGAIQSGTTDLGGPLGNVISSKIGCQRTIALGGIIMAIGTLAASFVSSIELLIITQGLLTGLGASFVFFSALCLPSTLFEKYRGVSTGIARSGAGVGGFGMSVLTEKLIAEYGVAWTLRITALMIFVIICGSSLLMDFPELESLKKINEEKKDIEVSNIPLEDDFPHGTTISTKQPLPSKPIRQVFRDPVFILIVAMQLAGSFAIFIPETYVPTYATKKLFGSKADGAFAIGIHNIAGIFGGITLGIVADRWLGSFWTIIGSFLLSASAILVLWTLSTTMEMFLIFNIINGFAKAGICTLIPVVISDVYGTDSTSKLTRMTYVFGAVGNIAGPPLVGLLLELFGWIPALLFAGFTLGSSAVFGFVAKIILNKRTKESS